MDNTAIIVVGEIRNKSPNQKKLFSKNLEIFNRENVFFSTYEEDAQELKGWKANILTIKRSELLNTDSPGLNWIFPKDFKHTLAEGRVIQHVHLRNCVERFCDKISKYDYVLKTRVDVNSNIQQCIQSIQKNPNKFSMASDLSYGCGINLFMKMFYENNFLNFVKKLINNDKSYVSLNHKNLLGSINSNPNCFKWWWIRYPNSIKTVSKDSVLSLCKKNINNNADIQTYEIKKDWAEKTIDNKNFSNHFSSEKYLALYALLFSEINQLQSPAIPPIIR
jgi:hypothetical protein